VEGTFTHVLLLSELTVYTHTLHTFMYHGKGKAVPYRPWQALRAPGGQGSQVFRQSAHEGGKVVRTYAPAAFTPQERFPVLISVRG
jgi:hypothetical protein